MGLVLVVGVKAEAKKVQFGADTLVVTRSVYTGTADTITPGQTLPLGCAGGPNGTTTVNVPLIAGGTTPVMVTCGVASDNGEFPNLNDSHNVWNNAATDGSFGITSPIFLDNLTTRGTLLGTLAVPTNLIVTSFSSKSELAINLSVDGNSLTFMGYQGGPGCGPNGSLLSPTAPNLIDVSASNTPGICDPTNAVNRATRAIPLCLPHTIGRSRKWMHRVTSLSRLEMPTAETTGARRRAEMACTIWPETTIAGIFRRNS